MQVQAVNTTPYCGTPPLPGTLAGRVNLDPVLLIALLVATGLHGLALRRAGQGWAAAAAGWGVVAVALLSPLCALSVALFSARVGQHMLLLLIAAPLIASGLRRPTASPWPPAAAFLVALWVWHMPVPYEATFRSDAVYWAMHLTLLGSGVWLWSALLEHTQYRAGQALAAGLATSMQMGVLGAVLTFSSGALFRPHALTTQAWGLSPLADQQLGGLLMWVPGLLLFVWAALRSVVLLLRAPAWRTA